MILKKKIMSHEHDDNYIDKNNDNNIYDDEEQKVIFELVGPDFV